MWFSGSPSAVSVTIWGEEGRGEEGQAEAWLSRALALERSHLLPREATSGECELQAGPGSRLF